MNAKNIFMVISLSSSLIYGIPGYLVQEVEEAECAITNLPKDVNEEQLSETKKLLNKCLSNLHICLNERYDEELSDKISILELDLQFLEECKDPILRKNLTLPAAKKWINIGYTYECYLNHFCK